MKNAALWKRVLNNGVLCRSPELTKENLESISQRIIRSTIIVDSRPRDEYAEEGRPWRWSEYKKIVFPFSEFWLEGCTVDGGLFGCLFKWWNILEHKTTYSGGVMPPREAVFHVSMVCVAAKAETPPGMICMPTLFLDEKMNLITDWLERSKIPALIPIAMVNALGLEKAIQATLTMVENSIDPLLMLSCKNVSLMSNENESKQVRRAIKRFGGTPESYRYHTLVVRPPGSKPGTQGQDIGIMPRHMCRGHFSEYGPEFGKGLLFGKLAGRFYIPPHLKGDKKNGIVEKDYEVRAIENLTPAKP